MLYRFEGVALSFAGREVLRSVSLQHNPGERLVLVGRNGSGKTSILRLIAGELEPERGAVTRARGVSTARVEQILQAVPEITALEFCLGAWPDLISIEGEMAALGDRLGDEEGQRRFHELQERFERLEGYRARPRVQAALEGMGVAASLHERPIGTLSGGERTRVALTRALLSPADLLLLDEPTNHLDLVGADYLATALAARERAMLVVTHDRDLIDRVGGAVLELHGGRIERYSAGYPRYRRERGARREQARKAYELQRQEIARQEEFIRRNIAGQNTRQAQARQNLLDRVERLDAPEPDLPPVRVRWPRAARSGDRVLETHGLDVGWSAPLVRGLDIVLRRGERLAVVGRNGVGKTTLLQALAGRQVPLAGTVRFGAGVVPGFYDQEHAELPGDQTVLESMLATRPDWTPAEARAWAGRFGFSGEAADAPCVTLSGGERSRLSLALLVAAGPNLMLLDEPTNHLDLATCEVLEEALRDFPGAVILVSHDRRLVERIATDVLLLADGGAVAVGRVEEAFARLGTAPPRAREAVTGERGARRSVVEVERRRLKREIARSRERAAAFAVDLEGAEERQREIDDLLCRPEVYSDHVQAAALAAEADTLRASIGGLMESWTGAEEDAAVLEARLCELTES